MMAQNYSQPVPMPGITLAYPRSQIRPPAPGAQAEEQSGPPPDPFQSIPGLQQPSLPGINLTSYGQNDQQSSFPSVAWPPHFPSDPNVWLSFLQGGMVPPPPLPGMPFPPPSFPLPPIAQNPVSPVAFPSNTSSQAPASLSNRAHELMDSDREEGELSDGELLSQPPRANANSQTHREPPRSAPLPSHTPTLVERMQKDRDDARQFVKLLNSNNIGYRALANEELDNELLRGLYQSLNLPSEPAPLFPPITSGSVQPTYSRDTNTDIKITSASKVQDQKPAPIIATSATLAPSSKSAASPTTPVDRKDYIARLQAAKMAKQAVVGKSSPPRKTVSVEAVSSTLATQMYPTPTAAASKPPVSEDQRARNTKLIKQRLEAIKAKQKPLAPTANGSTPSSSLPQSPKHQQTAAQKVVQPASPNISNSPASMTPFPGIPGLFMNNVANFNENTVGMHKPPSSIPQKQPIPSETKVLTPQPSVTPSTRTPNQIPRTHQEESLIIEVSDDESDGSDMDIENDHQTVSKSFATNASFQTQNQAPSVLPEFPSRSTSTKPTSAVGTPGPYPSANIAREKELEDKEKQLAAMRLMLKRKLAEKREKDKAAAVAAVVTSSSTPQGALTPLLTPQNGAPIRLLTKVAETIQPAKSKPIDSLADAAEVGVTDARSNKRLRRAEIESRLPALEAEIATNTSRMARLTREMEQLMAENQKIAKSKEELTQELDSLGVDTDGMSHADLRAKKDEMERKLSQGLELTSHNVAFASRPFAIESPTSPINTSPKVIPKPDDLEKKPEIPSWSPSGCANLPGLGQGANGSFERKMALAPTQIIHETSLLEKQVAALPPQQDISHSGKVRTGERKSSVDAAIAPNTQDLNTPLDDDEDFYSSASAAEGYATDAPQSNAEVLVTTQWPVDEGEIDMSESSEDEEEQYEPKEPSAVYEAPSENVLAPEPEVPYPSLASQGSSDDEEMYEPPEASQNLPHIQSANLNSQSILQPPQVEIEDGAMDMAMSSSEQSYDSDVDETTSSEIQLHRSISAKDEARQGTNNVENLAIELQADTASVLSASEIAVAENQAVKFTPYASPLRMFKSYRYHPSYVQDVAGGFLSLTFSHQIDAEKQLCQYESAGGTCNDAECPDQHFRDLNITGEKLLVQLGTANPGKSPEEKQKWNDGLRGVLKELRSKNIKDPNGIALEIAGYRRQFLNDDTRVVNL